MVLKFPEWPRVLTSVLVLVVVFSRLAWAIDPLAYEKAVALAQKNRHQQALRVLESNFNLDNRDLPMKVAQLATSLLLSNKNWRKAERVAETSLRSNWPGWPAGFDGKDSHAISKRFRGQPSVFLSLVKMSAEAKTQVFLTAGDELSPELRRRAKDEIKLYTDALITLNYAADEARSYWSQVDEQTVVQSHSDEYKFSVSLALSYCTWEDRPTFDYQLNARATQFTPCFGLNLNYSNGFYQWTGGGCFGAGVSDLEFNDGHFDDRGSITLIAGYGALLLRLTDAGSAFGVEGDALNVTISGRKSDGSRASATNQEFAFMAVGRFRVGQLEMKFKGGTVLSDPGALWVFELAYPIF